MSVPTDVTYAHRLTTADGQRIDVESGPGESIVDGAERAGVLLPASCRGGSCGSCHATARGDYELGEHNRAVLPEQDSAAGGVLLCRTYAHGPLDVTLPYDHSRLLFGTIPQRTGTITTLETVAADTVRLVLELGPAPDGGTGCEFEPGQFLELSPPGSTVRRAYSLANTANWDGVAELFIRLRPGGYFSEHVRAARVGDQLDVRGPQGAFGIRETGLRPRWFVGGGTGLAPLLSMLRRMAEWAEPYPARLFLGVNTPQDVFGTVELDEVAAALPGFGYEVAVWQPDAAWTGPTGTAADALARALPTAPAPPDLYVCGPPPLVEATRRVAADHGIGADRVTAEHFAPPQ
ncbi:MAG TPA: 2Fe-2S iron-sulfur cluster binding domain-containing protein [Actinoplanes sp.]|nr:2Fe-2S iron-sulfur cluster binding domain-containing protein [Actinoplanes sp.]